MVSKAFMRTKHPVIGYIMGGDPDPSRSVRVATAVLDSGADALEIGIPFSDPIADGSIIQGASARALDHGATPASVLQEARELTASYTQPVYLMSYLNPILNMGYTEFAERAVAAGVSGTIIPDLPVEMALEWIKTAQATGLETVFLVSPATSEVRMGRIARATTGFIYLVSVYGVTGERADLPAYLPSLVRTVKRATGKQVALGFGISGPNLVSRAIKVGCDGVIVGSSIIRRMKLADWEAGMNDIRVFVRSLSEAASNHS